LAAPKSSKKFHQTKFITFCVGLTWQKNSQLHNFHSQLIIYKFTARCWIGNFAPKLQ